MNRITWYIFQQLGVGLLIVGTGLTAIIWLTQSLRFVQMIVNNGLSMGNFVYLTMLLLPNFLTIILPIAFFIVVTFIYTKLISDRELIVMRATGLNQMQLAKPAVLLGIVVVMLSYGINVYLLPQTYKMFGEMKWDIRHNYSQVLLQEGAFNTVATGVTVYVRERTKEGHLLGLFVHDEKNKDKPYTLMAEKGSVIKHENGSRVLMFNGSRHEVDRKTNKFSILYFDRYVFDLNKDGAASGARTPEAREMTLDQLFSLEDQPYVSKRDYGKYTVEAHKRLASPVSALGYMMIALACLMSGGSTRRNQTKRVSLAVVLVVSMQILSLVVENAIAKNLSLIPLIYLNVLIPVIGGYVALHMPSRFSFLERAQS